MTKLTWTRTQQGELTAGAPSGTPFATSYSIYAAMSGGYDLLVNNGLRRWFPTEAEAQEAAQKYEDE